ncbi:MAG: NADH-quinone oxidoreductase subunit C [Acidimicrobiia bacterium]|nr:NADH-quinone oxidoreductase subunit C [Actinomycetota bacterium]MBL6924575.1 NADH-quinone oxidoreductase subunit C [Acidimicrobiia bacterium]MBL6926132.1 NADH-quinone oxidoreductase subunit C [Acidimicrobiia bacterium]
MSSPDTGLEEVSEGSEPASDAARDAIVATLAEQLGEGLVASEVLAGTDVWVRVTADSWLEAATVLRDRCGMAYFNFLSAIDWMPSPFGRDMDAQVDLSGEDPEVDPEPMAWGVTGGSTRFQMLARVHDPVGHIGVTLKADLDSDDPRIDSWIPSYPGADWHEREAWEMFGITIVGHPNLVNLYLPSQFEGNPLRKDYPLLARRVKPWPGIVDVELMPGDGDEPDDDGDGS